MAQRKFYRKIYKKNKKLSPWIKFLLGFFLFSVFCFAFVFIYYAKDLPRPEVFTEKSFILPTKIYDREGKVLLYQIYGEEKRTIITLDQVSESLKQAILATEDANFYHHFGLDPKGILRSVLNNFKIGRFFYASGSTISQQLIRSTFLTLEKTVQRKVKEIILTLELERRYSKDQILEFYLNQVPFGSNAYGVEAASQTFFEKPASEVSFEEAAILAALIQAPSRLSPYGENKANLLIRKNYVLDRMASVGYISQETAEKAKEKVLKFAETRYPIKAPHFVIYVKRYLEEKYSDYFLKEKGLKVYTTLNWELQEFAETAVREGVKMNQAHEAFNASLVAIDPKTGEILAMVGSADYFGDPYPEGCSPGINCLFEAKVNVAIYGEGRQPGSAFKPFVYAQAFRKGFTPDTVLWDVKTEFNPDCDEGANQEKDEYELDCYHPKNYDENFRGPVTFRQALAQSINLPSVKVLYLAGLKDVLNFAKSLGITTLDKPQSFYGLSLALGGGEAKLLDLVSAYGVFASGGLIVPPLSILKIEDFEGNLIEENKKTQKRVLEARVANWINDILSDNEARAPMFGNRSLLYLQDYDVAAKTGTTQEFKDAWIIGYAPNLVAGVWVGNNDGTPPKEEPGVVLAGPIWHLFMKKSLELYPKEKFNPPLPVLTEKPVLKEEVDWENPHSILYYIDKKLDPQYQNWEEGIKLWLATSTNF